MHMKIIFVVGELRLGGAERQLLLLARGLSALGHHVTIVVFRSAREGGVDAVTGGVEIVPLGGGGPLSAMLRLRRFVAKERPDIVHGYLTAGNIAALAARSLRPRPLVVWGVRASDMRMENYNRKWRLAAAVERRLAGLPDLMIVNSQAGRALLEKQGVPADRVATIENGVDLTSFAPDAGRRAAIRATWGIGDGQWVIGHVARIDPMKDHEGFFAALALLLNKRDDWHAVLIAVGDETGRERLRASAAAQALMSRVTITAAAANIVDIFPGFDLLCSSSAYGEGFSNVIAEALACGLPVVATDVGDARLIVGEAGRIVPASDPAALAAALDQSLENRATMAEKARGRIAGFSVEALAKRTAGRLETALAVRSGG